MTKTKHTFRWLFSFSLLFLYTVFLVSADSQRGEFTAHARDSVSIEEVRRTEVSLPGGIFRLLKPWVARECTVVTKRVIRCAWFPWILDLPSFPHIS